MKKLIVVLFVIGLCTQAFCQELARATAATVATPAAAFDWTQTTFDFGKTKVGEPVSFEFKFTNKGDIPLIISSVKASCGCTVTAYTKEPVGRGASGFVKATYDAAKAGVYSKTVAVTANTPEGTVHLTIKGEIVP